MVPTSSTWSDLSVSVGAISLAVVAFSAAGGSDGGLESPELEPLSTEKKRLAGAAAAPMKPMEGLRRDEEERKERAQRGAILRRFLISEGETVAAVKFMKCRKGFSHGVAESGPQRTGSGTVCRLLDHRPKGCVL